MMNRKFKSLNSLRTPRQQGIVLITALILLVLMTLAALLAVQGSISGEQVSRNLKTNAVAHQAAEAALRICENAVLSGTPTVVVNLVPLTGTATLPTLWVNTATWTNSATANTVTAVLANSTDAAARTLAVLPQCVIEEYPILTDQGGLPRASFMVTARGYSNDYRINAANEVISGSQVWLQSITRR